MKLKEKLPRALRQVPDSFQAFLVKDAEFTEIEEYPVLPSDFVSQKLPNKIMPFDKALNYRGDLSNTFISYYSPDASFNRVRHHPARYLNFFRRTAGIIGFDFSIHSDMPMVKQKSQINDNLSLTYFFGKSGIPVIPNLRCGVDELLPEFLTAIPSNTYVSIGTHGFIKEIWEQCEWYCFLEKVIPVLNPKGIIVYGSLPIPLINAFKNQVPFYFYEPWISQRRKKVSRHVV